MVGDHPTSALLLPDFLVGTAVFANQKYVGSSLFEESSLISSHNVWIILVLFLNYTIFVLLYFSQNVALMSVTELILLSLI